MGIDSLSITLVDSDYNFKSTLESTGVFSTINAIDSDDKESFSSKIVFISGSKIQPEKLSMYLETYCLESDMIYYKAVTQLSPINKTIIEQQGVKIIPHILSNRQCADKILASSTEDVSKDNCFVFFGASSKVGTTTVTQTLAKNLASKNISVCYVDCSGRSNYSYLKITEVNKQTYSLEDLRLKISNNILSDTEISQGIIKDKNGVYLLRGCKNLLTSKNFSVEIIEAILDRLRSIFTVVLVDAGSPSVSTISLGAITGVTNRFLVANGSLSSYEDYSVYHENVISPLGINDLILLSNSPNKPTIGQEELSVLLSKYKSGKPMVSFPYLDSTTSAEVQQTLISDIVQKRNYSTSVEALSKFILTCLNLNNIETSKSKFSLFKLGRWYQCLRSSLLRIILIVD